MLLAKDFQISAGHLLQSRSIVKLSVRKMPTGISIDSLLSVQCNLEELWMEIDCRVEVLEAVAEYGAGLGVLSLRPYIADREALTSMLKVVGRSLYQLSLSFRDRRLAPDIAAFDLKEIGGLCQHVLYVNLMGVPSYLRQDEFEMYCAYGPRLKHLSLHGIGPDLDEKLECLRPAASVFTRLFPTTCPIRYLSWVCWGICFPVSSLLVMVCLHRTWRMQPQHAATYCHCILIACAPRLSVRVWILSFNACTSSTSTRQQNGFPSRLAISQRILGTCKRYVWPDREFMWIVLTFLQRQTILSEL